MAVHAVMHRMGSLHDSVCVRVNKVIPSFAGILGCSPSYNWYRVKLELPNWRPVLVVSAAAVQKTEWE